jgi:hypothetical protein
MGTFANARLEVKRDLALEVLRLHGEARLPGIGASMLPTIWPGDILEVRHESPAEIAPGDLVVFERDGCFVAHRVVRRGTGVPPVRGHGQDAHATTPTFLITRGDRMRRSDPPVLPEELLGRVTMIVRGNRRIAPGLTRWGRVISWVLSRSHFCTRVLMHLNRVMERPGTRSHSEDWSDEESTSEVRKKAQSPLLWE